jgi:hypothetical protein
LKAEVGDLALLEGLHIQVDLDGRAFMLPTQRVPFDAVLRVQVKVEEKHGTVGAGKRDPAGTAWREVLVDVLLVTDDRMDDPRLVGLGLRSYATDGTAPDLDAAPLRARARAVAEAAARVCNRKVVG